ncbi:MAG: DUF2252 family protein [Candidatus Wallbacteria bacterium]|nr:DUF2252 family protein [Candidatus Wallbacteria bacterium]
MSPRWLLPVLLLATTAPWAPAGQPWADRDPAREIRAHDRELAGRNPEGYREKCRRMSQDAFAFFRGTSYPFYKDLAAGAARELDPFVPTAARAVWLQGD